MVIDSKGVVSKFEFTISYYNHNRYARGASGNSTSSTSSTTSSTTTDEADSDKRFSVCTGCKNNKGCTAVLKGTIEAYDCIDFKLEIAKLPVAGCVTDQCKSCTFDTKCDTDFSGDDFYKLCPLVNGGTDDMHIDSENADCSACSKADKCDDVYTFAPVECGKFDEKDYDITI